MSKVLACIDASVYGASVCDHAAWAARQLGAPVELLHVLDRAPDAVPSDLSGSIGLGAQEHLLQELARLDEARARLRMERGRALLEEAERRVRAEGVDAVATRLRHGGLVDVIADLEAEAGLVVLGKRGEHADFASLHLGGSVEQVVRASALPVLVASRAFAPIRRLAVAFDGGASARRAVEFLCGNPSFAAIERHVVMAGPARQDSEAHLDWARGKLDGQGGAFRVERRDGDPATVLGAYVKEHAVDLLVMGAYGHSPIRRLIVGSTTTTMIRTCLVPVLLFR